MSKLNRSMKHKHIVRMLSASSALLLAKPQAQANKVMIDGLINMEIDPIGERVAIGSPPVIFASWNKETRTLVSIHSPPADAQVDPDNLRIVRENISKLETQDAHLQELKANFIKSLGFPIEDSKISSTSVRPAIVAGSPALLPTIVADSYAQPR